MIKNKMIDFEEKNQSTESTFEDLQTESVDWVDVSIECSFSLLKRILTPCPVLCANVEYVMLEITDDSLVIKDNTRNGFFSDNYRYPKYSCNLTKHVAERIGMCSSMVAELVKVAHKFSTIEHLIIPMEILLHQKIGAILISDCNLQEALEKLYWECFDKITEMHNDHIDEHNRAIMFRAAEMMGLKQVESRQSLSQSSN